MPSAQEVFRVVGKVVLEGEDAVTRTLTSLGKSAETLDKKWSSTLSGMEKDVPKNVTKPIDDSVNKTEKEIEGLGKTTSSAMDKIKTGFAIAFGSKTFDLIANGAASIGKGLFNSAIEMNSTLETTTLQFATLMGSADKAKDHVAFLFEFAKKTPFETGPIIQASRMLQTFGGDALNTEKNLTLMGDASAAVSAPIEEVGTWVGRLYAALKAGQPFGEAAARLQELAIMSPQARTEMEKMQKAGKSADEIFGFFQKDMEKFTGAMEKQAGTWDGLKSTFSDTINILSAQALKPFFDLAKTGLTQIVNILGSDAFGKGAQKIADALAKGIGGAISGLISLIEKALPIIQNLFSQAQTFVSGFGDSFGEVQTNIMDVFDAVIPQIMKYVSTVQGLIENTFIPTIIAFANQIRPAFTSTTDYIQGTVIPAYEKMGAIFASVFLDTMLPAISNFYQKVVPVLANLAGWWLTNILPRIEEFSSQVINILTNILYPSIQRFIQNIMPLVNRLVDFFAAEMLPKLKEFGAQILTVWDELGPTIIPLLQQLATAISVVLDVIGGFIKDHGDQIMYWVSLAWNQVSGVIKAVLEVITNVINLALNLIQGDWQGAWENVQGIFKGVWDYILAVFSPAITIIKSVMGELQPLFTSIWNAIQSVTSSVWSAISNVITTTVNAIQSIVQTVMNTIQMVWSTIWNAIQLVADTVWRAIETIVRVEMALVQTIMEPILNAIQTLWETVWGAIQTKLQTIWDYINNNIVTPAMNAMETTITTIINAIKTTLETVLNAVQATWNTIWSAIETTFTTTWNAIQTTANTIWNAIKDTATTIWNGIKDAITTPITETQTGLEGIWNTIKTKAEEVWNGLKSSLGGIATDIKNALMGPFESFRDGIGSVMESAKSNLLSPLQKAIDGIASFVGGVRDGINSISSKLGLGDIIKDVWGGSRIAQLAKGTKNWSGGPAMVGEKGPELVRLPDGTYHMFSDRQLVNMPKGATVYTAQQTKKFVDDNPNQLTFDGMSDTPDYYAAQLYGKQIGQGGIFGGIGDKIKSATGSVLEYAQSFISKSAEAVVSEIIDKLPVPSFPGTLSGMGGAIVGKVKDSVLSGMKELVDVVKKNVVIDEPTSTDPDTWGAPGTINGVSGTHIMEVAQRTMGGILGYCEKWVGDVMANAGVRYARANSALEHSGMQTLRGGLGPTGAPVFFPYNNLGDVAISMGNGMVYGTEGGRGRSQGAGPFRPGTPLGHTLNPAANGMVVNRPTAVLAGENSASRPEIISPVDMMARVFRGELQRSGQGMVIQIHVTANTDAEGYAAGQAAAKGFRDKMLEVGFNR